MLYRPMCRCLDGKRRMFDLAGLRSITTGRRRGAADSLREAETRLDDGRKVCRGCRRSCGRSSGHGLMSLLTALVQLAALPCLVSSSTLSGVVHMPTMIDDGASYTTPDAPVIMPLNRDGQQDDTAVKNFSQYQYAGCFRTTAEIRSDVEPGGIHYDPTDCIERCAAQGVQMAPAITDRSKIIAAVKGSICGCVYIGAGYDGMATFEEESPDLCEGGGYGCGACTLGCRYFDNPMCGGPDDWWGVFMQYDYMSLSSTGAYDPWKYVLYTVVVIQETSIRGETLLDTNLGLAPERYYLHASDTQTGDAAFQYQSMVPHLLLGIQYDLDSTRIVGIELNREIGRRVLAADTVWEYFLKVILVNKADDLHPKLQWELEPPQLQISMQFSQDWLAFPGCTQIASRFDVFVFTQAQPSAFFANTMSRIYYVSIPSGDPIPASEYGLDFPVRQLLINEKYGDVTAVGNRNQEQHMLLISRIYENELEQRVYVEQIFTPGNVIELAPDRFMDVWVHPNVGSSEHLNNKSYTAFREYPNDPAADRTPSLYGMLVMELSIRGADVSVPQIWCDPDDCLSTVDYRAPYTAIYNAEPRIPLSLPAPSLESARFTMEADRIQTFFDRATLRGATYIDENNDDLPDLVDFMNQQPLNNPFDCAQIFDDATVALIGPYEDGETSCEWIADDEVQIDLPPVFLAGVGDMIFVRQDTIYTKPAPPEFSMAAQGGIRISLPSPLEYPVIRMTGDTFIDVCSNVYFSAADSYFTGSLPTYQWSLTANPEDLRETPNVPEREYNATKLALLRGAFRNATDFNSPVLSFSGEYLMEDFTFNIMLEVTSRWLLTSNYSFVLTKLGFPSPMVNVIGPSEPVTRQQRVNLLAQGTPSECSTGDSGLSYSWAESSEKLSDAQLADMTMNSKTLVIEPYILEPVGVIPMLNIYNFTVTVFVTDDPDKATSASVQVDVTRSEVSVVLTAEDRLLSIGQVLVIDARLSNDPDYPTLEGNTFSGDFHWYCKTPDRTPCFGFPEPGQFPEPLPTCETDINQRITVAGRTFSAPIFSDDVQYCKWARGVLMVDTSTFVMGDAGYLFTIEIEAPDGRTASKEVIITMTDLQVPQISLRILDPQVKYSITETIRIQGTIESGVSESDSLTYSWTIMVRSTNPLYSIDDAAEAEANGLPYNIDQEVYLDHTTLHNLTDPLYFTISPSVPDMIIHPMPALRASKDYKIRLNIDVNDGEIEGFSEIGLETAGLPPSGGTFTCDPSNATMDTPRTLTAGGWSADDQPVTYDFGYFRFLAGEQIRQTFVSTPLTAQQYVVQDLPVGEPSTNYTLILFVDITTPFGAQTTALVAVQSSPPENVSGVIADTLANARTQDPETAVNSLSTVLDLQAAPTPAPGETPDDEVLSTGMEIMEIMQEVGPEVHPTPNAAVAQAVVINGVIDSGLRNETSMNVLESSVMTWANAGLFSVSDPALITATFGALSGMLPDEFGVMGGVDLSAVPAAAGQGSSMYQYARDVPEDEQLPFLAADGFRGPNVVRHIKQMRESTIMPRGGYGSHHAMTPVVGDCSVAYCDIPNLICALGARSGLHRRGRMPIIFFTCCNARNPETVCMQPPCWFYGNECPLDRMVDAGAAGPFTQYRRRLSQYRRRLETPTQPRADTSRLAGRKLTATGAVDPAAAPAPVGNVTAPQDGAVILQLEADEMPLWERTQVGQQQKDREEDQFLRAKARQEAYWATLPTLEGTRLRQEAEEQAFRDLQIQTEMERLSAQIVTRVAVLRDTVCKLIIVQMAMNEEPQRYSPAAFYIYFGKTRNMSEVHQGFLFPDKFVVPSTVGDNPTPDDPRSAFSFIFLKYRRNIYGWSRSAPPGKVMEIITLIIMRAAEPLLEVEVVNESNPIQVFRDQAPIWSNGLCMYWDRFAPNSPGGAWSSRGLLNNADACLTTHLSDMGLFMDGRSPVIHKVDSAVSLYVEEFEDVGTNLSMVAILGLIILVATILSLAAYIQDELERERQRMGKSRKATFHLDGDGVHEPISVRDPIAYKQASRRELFLAMTFWHVIQRDHALISPLFFSEGFTRPQRILCLSVMVTGVFAVNAAIYGNPNYIVSSSQYVPSGILSGLVSFPLYCCVVVMFAARPTYLKQRLPKRKTRNEQPQALQKVRADLVHKSTMRPPPGYTALPPLSGVPANFGGTTILSLPAPVAAFPQLPPPFYGAMAATPKLQLPVAGLPGLPAPGMLPPLPALKAAAPKMAQLPPLPKYPINRARLPALPASNLPALQVGTLQAPPPPPPPGSRGASGTPMAGNMLPLPGTLTPPGQRSGTLTMPGAAVPPAPPRELQAAASHQMMAPAQPPLPPMMGPPPKAPGTPTNIPGTPEDDNRYATPRTPTLPPPGTPGSFTANTPTEPPPPPPMLPGLSHGIVHRGEPTPLIPPPFKPPGAGPALPGLPPGFAPPTMGSTADTGFSFGPPLPPPPPPPPPREDDQTFVRRMRLVHMERAQAAHEQVLLNEESKAPVTTPHLVFMMTLLAPYTACLMSIICQVFVALAYSTKFKRVEEVHWYYASAIGVGLCLTVLEVIRCAVTTVVELREFEIRRGMHSGDFLQSRVRRAEGNDAPPLKIRKPPVRRPPVPKVAPKAPPSNAPPPPPPPTKAPPRPSFLPEGPPSNFLAGSAKLPVGGPPPPPPPNSRPQGLPKMHGLPPLRTSQGMSTPLGGGTPIGTPPITPGGGGPRNDGQGASLLPGRLDNRPGGGSLSPGPGRMGAPGPPAPPPMPGRVPGPSNMPGGRMPPSPSGSLRSAHSQSLQDKLKASRTANVPPPPGGPPGPPSGGATPPTLSRSGSLRAAGLGATPPKPSMPPPPGNLQQARAARRAGN